jgi:hypothetical protein
MKLPRNKSAYFIIGYLNLDIEKLGEHQTYLGASYLNSE